MTRETLDKLRSMGMTFGPEYDILADTLEASRKNDADNTKISNIEYKPAPVIFENYSLQKNYIIKITLNTDHFKGTVEIEIEDKIYQAFQKKTFEQNAFYCNIAIDEKLFIITNPKIIARLKVDKGKVIGTKTKEIIVNNKNAETVTEKCYCNRDFSVEEFKYVVTQLRKKEVYIENGRLIKDSTGKPILKNTKKQFEDITIFDEIGENLFFLKKDENIKVEEANFIDFTKAINKTFKDYEINTCIRKIHFLAQCYRETQRFTLTYEDNPNSSLSGGAKYRGRGLIQLSHDYNYEKLQKKVNDKSALIDFAPKVAQEINIACQASGYYWKYAAIPSVAKNGNMNPLADKDDILEVSKAINGDVKIPNGLQERKIFTNLLKTIFDYEKCKNNKK